MQTGRACFNDYSAYWIGISLSLKVQDDSSAILINTKQGTSFIKLSIVHGSSGLTNINSKTAI